MRPGFTKAGGLDLWASAGFEAEMLFANPRDFSLQLDVELCLCAVTLAAKQLNVGLAVRAAENQRNDVIELGSQLAADFP